MSTYVHVVLFTLRDDVSEDAIETMICDAKGLSSIPTVRRLDCGRRDTTMLRPVSDTGYHVGLLVCFDDRNGFDTYAVHPTHADFVARHKPNWAGLRVCDFSGD
jgi:hypothetical protein